jgi:hypothetical protein
MAHSGLLNLTLLVLAIPTAAGATDFGPGQATALPPAPHAAQDLARKADFKVLVWYRRNDPLGTFKYEIYDLRRGQNIREIDAWLAKMRTEYPAYVVIVHDVDLEREHGATESLKVGSVVQRELLIAAGMAGIVVGGGLNPGLGQRPGLSATTSAPARSALRPTRLPELDRSFLNPNPTSFPVPAPYPRLPR